MTYFFFILSLFAVASSGSPKDWKSNADKIIEKEISGIKGSKSDFGIWVKRGKDVAFLNADQLMVPASLSKIPTALTFLEEHSMEDRFHTWIYKTGDIKDGVLKGDLYLKGGGDPSFVSESMWLLINELKRTDLKKVEGKLYVDESWFDDDYYSEGRQQRRVDRAYDAPISGLSFNWNSISIYVRPGDKVGAPARVYTDPDLPSIKIVNRATTASIKKSSLQVERRLAGDGMEIIVNGKISTSEDEKAFYKSVGDATLWTGQTFKKLLNQSGIEYAGDITKKVTPKSADQLVEYDSWSIARILAALSKFSNNFVAETLTKQIGKSADKPASIDSGIEKITGYLKKKGWKPKEFVFVNPSGFTRENRMRADRLGELLEKAKYDFQSAPEFMASLPISGTDGTLKTRMRQTMKGKVRAKTGYLSGVVGLAGYMETPGPQEPITFVFLYNGPSKKDWEVRAMFNRLLWRIYQKS